MFNQEQSNGLLIFMSYIVFFTLIFASLDDNVMTKSAMGANSV